MAKLSKTAQWMADHPDDTPCPRGYFAAASWRRKRGLQRDRKAAVDYAKAITLMDRYEAAMNETRRLSRGDA